MMIRFFKDHFTVVCLWNQTHLLPHRSKVQRVKQLLITV